jgi:hypothetical protein
MDKGMIVRSPNYPSISLSEAITKVDMIYRKEHTHPTTREVLATDMGYSSVNGASMGVISALLKYGLLETRDDLLRISSDAQTIIEYPKGDPERAMAIFKAGLKPAMFTELRNRYGDTLPSEDTLRAYLVTKRGFNTKAVSVLIRAYRDTMLLLADESPSNIADADGDEMEEDMQPVAQVPSRGSAPGSSKSTNGGRVERAVPSYEADLVWVFQIEQDCLVKSVFQGQVTQEAINRFIRILEVHKEVLPHTLRRAAVGDEEHRGRHLVALL